ncbi:collagen alpha-1(VII) chain [Anguilla rostrata]|uniref:collagen alpha-1(VII) chain n=1 Tax=Anguilla rostrata TaxID=7938 RepID=UPI0030CD9369
MLIGLEPFGRRGRSKPCHRGPPGTPGQSGGNGELGPEGAKGEKGDPGLSVEEVRELVTKELSEKCGKDFLLTVNSVDPDAESILRGDKEDEEEEESALSHSDSEDTGSEDKEIVTATQLMTTSNNSFNNITSGEGRGEWGRKYRRHPPALFSGLTSDPCLAPMLEGSCTEYILQWYHHGRSGECRPFLYGGCGGNHNRFATKQACQRRCEGGKRDSER